MAFHKIDVVGGEIDQETESVSKSTVKLMVYCFSPYRGLKQ